LTRFNIKARFGSLGSKLKSGGKEAALQAEIKEAQFKKYGIPKIKRFGLRTKGYAQSKYEQYKSGKELAREEQEEFRPRVSHRITIGTSIRSPRTGTAYLVVGQTKTYYITKSGLHLPKSKVEDFEIIRPSRVSSKISGLIQVGKRAYKSYSK